MKRLLPYILSILGVLVSLWLMTRLDALATAVAQRNWRIPWQFWQGEVLLELLVGVLLAAPAWQGWPHRFTPDWPVLFLYLVPGLLLATGRLTFPLLYRSSFGPLVAWGLSTGMLSSSAAVAGGILAGYGIGQCFRPR